MSGTLGTSNPAANTLTTVYTVATGKTGIFNISVANTSGTPLTINLALAAAATPNLSEYIEYGTVIPGNSVLERGGLMASSTKNVVAYVSTANAAINVYGYEE